MWKKVTLVEKEEQDNVVLLDSLEGTAKEEKATADGLKKLIEKLDSVFKREKINGAYEAYSNFTKFTKSGF